MPLPTSCRRWRADRSICGLTHPAEARYQCYSFLNPVRAPRRDVYEHVVHPAKFLAGPPNLPSCSCPTGGLNDCIRTDGGVCLFANSTRLTRTIHTRIDRPRLDLPTRRPY